MPLCRGRLRRRYSKPREVTPWLNILVPSAKVYSQNVWSKICDLVASPPSRMLAAAHAVALDRILALDPAADIQVVDVLLADLVTGEPVEVVPVVALERHFGLVVGLRLRYQMPPPFQ